MPLYGLDYAVQNLNHESDGQNIIFPIFGINKNDNGFVAVIENGDANATIHCLPRNDVYNKSIVYASFEIQKREIYSSESMLNNTELIKYGNKIYKKRITIDYYLLTGEKANYTGMAEVVQNKIFNNRERTKENALPLYIDTYGVIMRRERILGYPIKLKRSLTTYNQAQELINSLMEKGIKNISLRYCNWSMDENENRIKKVGVLPDVLGGRSNFKNLLIFENQIDIFANVQLLVDRSSGILADKENAKMMDGSTAIYKQKGIMAEAMKEKRHLKMKNPSMIVKIFPKIQKKLNESGLKNLSLSSVGSTLYSNFGDSTYLHRYEMQDQMVSLLKHAAASANRIMVESGNYYTLPYVTDIVDLPTSDSRLLSEKESVPFVQIVLHGYINYTGQPLNLADNYQNGLLRSVEYGCGLRYTLNFAEAEMLKNTQYSYLFSTNFSYWKEKVIAEYKKAQQVLGKVQNAKIIEHFSPLKDLYVTGYDNGVNIAVNYGSTASSYNGITISAKDYALL